MFRLHHVFIRAETQRNESQMEWQVKLLKAVCQCLSRFVSGSIVRVPECVRARSRATFSARVNDTDLFVAWKDGWIEETVSFKMSQDFLRQFLITPFPSAHEADHHSTARFHECDAWLSFALYHCSSEHVIRLELRQSIRRLFHHNSSVRRTSSETRNTEWAPISEWNLCCVVCHPRSVCGWFKRT